MTDRQTRILGSKAPASPSLVHPRGNPLLLRVSAREDSLPVTPAASLRAEIRASQTDTGLPLATVQIDNPTGSGPWDLRFSGAQMNQDLRGRSSRDFWLVIYFLDVSGDRDTQHASALSITEDGASLDAAQPPDVGMLLDQSTANALYAPVTAVPRIEALEQGIKRRAVVKHSGAAVTITAEDLGRYVSLSHPEDGTATVPGGIVSETTPNEFSIFNDGPGNREILAGEGVTLKAREGGLTLEQYMSASFVETDPDVWDVSVAGSTTPIAPKPVATTAPVITGKRRVGSVLSGSYAGWTEVPLATSRTWLRDGEPIPGASGPTYTLTNSDAGKLISVRDTATNAAGSTSSTSTEIEHIATPIANVVTDTGINPVTSLAALAGEQDGLRIFVDQPDVTEGSFLIHYSINGGAVKKVEAVPFGCVFLRAPKSAVIRLATAAGRTLKVARTICPKEMATAQFPLLGSANCDKACPPIWSPAAAHVTLPRHNMEYQLLGGGVERSVFISEFDGTSWTPPRRVLLPAVGMYTLKASFPELAFCNEDGAPVAVRTPAGSAIGGVSVTAHLPFLPVTGQSRVISSEAEFFAAAAVSVAGDEIVATPKFYAFTQAVTNSTFAANHLVGGRQGAEGIMIRSQSGNPDDTIFSGVSGTDGDWFLERNPPLETALPFMMRDITFNFTNLDAGFRHQGGYTLMENVHAYGPQAVGCTKDLFSLGSHVLHGRKIALRCSGRDALADIWNLYGGGVSVGGFARLISCQGHRCGNALDSQCLTTHDGLRLEVYGGYYSDSHTYVVQGANNGDPTYMFWVKTRAGLRKAGLYWISAIGCDFGDVTNDIKVLPNGYLKGCKIAGAPSFANTGMFREAMDSNADLSGNLIACPTSAYFPNVATRTRFRRNILVGGTSGIRVDSDGTAGAGTIDAIGNSIIGAVKGLLLNPLVLKVAIAGTAAKGNTTSSIDCSAASITRITPRGGSTLNSPVDADYIAGPGDILGAAAELDANYFPVRNGNCHANTSLAETGEDSLGGTDAWGLPIRYSSTKLDRGGRGLPTIDTDAELCADVWLAA